MADIKIVVSLRVVIVSYNGLPDSRIERVARFLKSKRHEIIFVGGGVIRRYSPPLFDEVYSIPKRDTIHLMFNSAWIRKWRSLIKKLEPDLLHLSNIQVAGILYNTGVPCVYDDRELWSLQIHLRTFPRNRKFVARILHILRSIQVGFLEKRIVSSIPTIVTNRHVAAIHKSYAKWVGVIENFLSSHQVRNLPIDKEREGLVYIGKDFKLREFTPHRDMTGLKDHVDFDVVYGLPHHEMMVKLTNYKYGLTPWHFHPILYYKNQNKNYEYLHAGLQVILGKHLSWQFPELPFIHAINNYSEIPRIINENSEVDPLYIARYARENFLWENRKEVLLEAYEKALEIV